MGIETRFGLSAPVPPDVLTRLLSACISGACPLGDVCENNFCVESAENRRKSAHFVN